MDNYAVGGPRFRTMECNPCAMPGYFNPNLGPASEGILRQWMPPRSNFGPSFLSAPPFFCLGNLGAGSMPTGDLGAGSMPSGFIGAGSMPTGSLMDGQSMPSGNLNAGPMPEPGYQSALPFQSPFGNMGYDTPPCPPRNQACGGFQPSVPNYGAEYRYPEYGMIKERAQQYGSLDGTPITPSTSFQQDEFHTQMLGRLSQRAEGRLNEAAQYASPREFHALLQNENRLEYYAGFEAGQGHQLSQPQIDQLRSQGIEQLYQDGGVGQGIGQANREAMELQDAAQRSQANLEMKYGIEPQPGLPPQYYQQSPFNPERQQCQQQQQTQRPPHLADQQQEAAKPEPPKKPAYDPNADSNGLYKSMHGGLFGFGHDSDALFKALDGKTPEQIDQIRANYKDHYGKDLDADLKDKLGGKELDRANELLKGNQSAADAAGISKAFGTLWNDNKGIETLLAGKSPEQIKKLSEEYKNQTGNDLKTDLSDKMSGADKDKALALLDGDKAKAAVADIKKADGWFSTDGKAITATLEGKSPEERAAISKAYKEKYGVDLKDHLNDDLGGAQRDEATAALDGNVAKAEAAKIRDAKGIFWSDDKAIDTALAGKTDAERKQIAAEFKSTYGSDLKDELQDDLSGSKLEKAQTLLDKGKLSDAQSMQFALDQTDKDTIKATLAGKTKGQIAQMSAEYEQSTGRSLQSDIGSKLSGRDLFQAQQDMKGKPTSVEEAVERANEAHKYERDGGFGQSFVDTFSDKGERLDTDNGKINASNDRYQQLKSEGRFAEAQAERQNLEKLVGYSSADVDNYQDAKDSAANTAGTVAATAAGVAVCVATAGTATPILAAVAMAATAGAGAKVLAANSIEGSDYSREQASSDLLSGAIDGGTAVIGMGAGGAAAEAGEQVAVQTAERTVGRVVLDGAVQGAKDGAVMGGVGSAAHKAVESDTWDQGLGEGLQRIGNASTVGTLTGMVAGGVMGGGMAAGRKLLTSRAAAESTELVRTGPETPPPTTPGGGAPPPTGEIKMPTSNSEALQALGLKDGASAAEIKAAYRDMAQQFHPDKLQENATDATTARMQQINVARDLLKRSGALDEAAASETATSEATGAAAGAGPKVDWREVAGFKVPEADKGDWMVKYGMKMNSTQRAQWNILQAKVTSKLGLGEDGALTQTLSGWKNKAMNFVRGGNPAAAASQDATAAAGNASGALVVADSEGAAATEGTTSAASATAAGVDKSAAAQGKFSWSEFLGFSHSAEDKADMAVMMGYKPGTLQRQQWTIAGQNIKAAWQARMGGGGSVDV